MGSRDKRVIVNRKDDSSIELIVEGYPYVFTNAIRRLTLSDVPTLAIDYIYVYDNSSSVFDEILAHRLGLLVLDSTYALEKMKSPEECKNADEEDESCYTKIILDVGIDENASEGRYVNAGELSVDEKVTRIVYPETPLLYLIPGQRVHAVAYARLGRGREHAKWSPVAVAVMQYVPIVRYDGSRASEECLKCLEAYPEVREKLEKGEKGEMEIAHHINTSGLLYCSETECKEALELTYNQDKQILYIESTGSLSPERIVLESARILEARAKGLIEALKELEVEEK
ncbi:MAG: DNA-directed RNA polymerase subunit D [Desulfurococcales archaeon]|nr:DNA-directed RNA polymerase subunit D [Desulfurococcales archaeon]